MPTGHLGLLRALQRQAQAKMAGGLARHGHGQRTPQLGRLRLVLVQGGLGLLPQSGQGLVAERLGVGRGLQGPQGQDQPLQRAVQGVYGEGVHG
jgi:hypothetical protein